MRWLTAALVAGWANVLIRGKMGTLSPVSDDKRSALLALAGGTGYGVPVFPTGEIRDNDPFLQFSISEEVSFLLFCRIPRAQSECRIGQSECHPTRR